MKDNNNKDAYWFSHDSNAKDDPKCVLMIDQLGLEGYGIYWVLVEILREQPDFSYPLALVPAIAKRYGTTAPKVEAVIKGFGLFGVREDKFFYSQSLISRVLAFKEKQDKKTAAALRANMLRWEAERKRKEQGLLPNGIQTESERNPDGVQSESDFIPIKGNKIKGKENINSSSSKDSELCPSQEAPDARPLNFPQDNEVEEKEILTNKQCQQVVDYWNRRIGETGAIFPKAETLNDKRKAKIRTRWREFAKIGDPVEVCRKIFDKACDSKFLQGDNQRGWKADFDWLFTNESNWAKVYEGNYDNRTKPQASRMDQLEDDLEYIHNLFNGGQQNDKTGRNGVDEQ